MTARGIRDKVAILGMGCARFGERRFSAKPVESNGVSGGGLSGSGGLSGEAERVTPRRREEKAGRQR